MADIDDDVSSIFSAKTHLEPKFEDFVILKAAKQMLNLHGVDKTIFPELFDLLTLLAQGNHELNRDFNICEHRQCLQHCCLVNM